MIPHIHGYMYRNNIADPSVVPSKLPLEAESRAAYPLVVAAAPAAAPAAKKQKTTSESALFEDDDEEEEEDEMWGLVGDDDEFI